MNIPLVAHNRNHLAIYRLSPPTQVWRKPHYKHDPGVGKLLSNPGAIASAVSPRPDA
jgi:hypothetical protein